MLQANDIKEAFDNTNQVMKNTMGDYTIPMIMESPIMDVFPYFSGEEGDLEQVERFNATKASKPSVVASGETDEDVIEIEEEELADTI